MSQKKKAKLRTPVANLNEKDSIEHYNAILIEEIQSSMKAVIETVHLSQEQTNRKFEKIETRMDQNHEDLKVAIAHNSTGIAKNGMAIEENTTAIKQLDSKVDANTKAIKQLDTKVDKNTVAIKQIGSKVDENTTAIKQIGSKVDENTKAIKQVDAKVDKIGNRLGTVENKVEKHDRILSNF